MAEVTVVVPDIGDFTDVPVAELIAEVGQQIAQDDPLLALESDKAVMEIPAPEAGRLVRFLVAVGDGLSAGDAVCILETDAPDDRVAAQAPAALEADDRAATETSPVALPASAAAPAAESDASSSVYASPLARRVAAELGVDLTRVEGSGMRGRIRRSDVEAAAQEQASAGAQPERAERIERRPLSRIQKLSAQHLTATWAETPQVTQHDEADITDLEAFRRQINSEAETKVTMVTLLLAALPRSLKAFPEFNAELDGDEIILKHFYNLGFAADTPQGLVVPVVHDADGKGILDLAGQVAALAERARAGRLSPADLADGSFTLSSLGGIGGTGFTPIVNRPQTAILGVSRSVLRPVWDGQEFVPRLMLPLSLSYDHRVIDGAAAARFCAHLSDGLADLRRLLL